MSDESLQWNASKEKQNCNEKNFKKRDRNEGIERSKKENEILSLKQQTQ